MMSLKEHSFFYNLLKEYTRFFNVLAISHRYPPGARDLSIPEGPGDPPDSPGMLRSLAPGRYRWEMTKTF